MESFVFSLNAVSPIIIMVAIGYILKRIGLVSADFVRSANRLVFRLFLPAMLFLNVYNINALDQIRFGYIIYVLAVLMLLFTLSILAVFGVTNKNERRGVLLQASFRSNFALIGIPLAQSLFGQEGVSVATMLSAVAVPLYNVLAVISLSVFGKETKRINVKHILLDIIKNPLIQSIAAGIVALVIRSLLVRYDIEFRISDITPIYSVLDLLGRVATPLALIVLGAQFEFSAVSSLKREIIFGVLMRTVVFPLVGIGVAYLFFRDYFNGAHFATFVAFFATPVAVSSVPMTQEMGGDVTLAGQLVVWTTMLSAMSVFLSSYFLSLGGVF